MAADNHTTIIGNLVEDPEVRFTQSGIAVTAKVERAHQRGNGDRTQGRERQIERGGDFNDPAPF